MNIFNKKTKKKDDITIKIYNIYRNRKNIAGSLLGTRFNVITGCGSCNITSSLDDTNKSVK